MTTEEQKRKLRKILLIAAATEAVVLASRSEARRDIAITARPMGRSLADVMLSDLSSSFLTKSWNGGCGYRNACQCREKFKLAAVKNIKHGIHQQKPRKGFNSPL